MNLEVIKGCPPTPMKDKVNISIGSKYLILYLLESGISSSMEADNALVGIFPPHAPKQVSATMPQPLIPSVKLLACFHTRHHLEWCQPVIKIFKNTLKSKFVAFVSKEININFRSKTFNRLF